MIRISHKNRIGINLPLADFGEIIIVPVWAFSDGIGFIFAL
jgi:hypothetical protein